jgi:FkbM family methyltransferase
MYVRLDDRAVGLGIAIRRSYEKHIVEAMLPFLMPGAVFVDVGANIGFYTLLAASRVGPSGKVIAFEPSSANCELIEASVRKNGFTNVVVQQAAVADITGTIGYRQTRYSSNGVVGNFDDFPQRVRAVTLDACLQGEERVDVVKMDVEGAEGLVLSGMLDLIEEKRPVIFSEFIGRALPLVSHMSAHDFLYLLTSRGYDVFGLDEYGRRSHSVERLARESDEPMPRGTHDDLICIPTKGFG